MTSPADRDEVARFRQVLAHRLGWSSADLDRDRLAEALRHRAARRDLLIPEYLAHLGTAAAGPELTALAEELAITETYFFRHAEQFHAVAEVVLPALVRSRADQRRLRLLSVGCASGEEAYTLAIVARQTVPDPAWDVSVLGLDVNPEMLRRAGIARYSRWSLRETPESVRQRWFRPDGGQFELDASVRAGARFVRYNAAEEDIRLWPAAEYDLVFCRNLLMYLNPETAQALIGRITRSLAPGGYLFLGHTDTLGAAPAGLRPRASHNTFYYERTATPPVAAPVTPPSTAPVVAPAAAAGPPSTAPVTAPGAAGVRLTGWHRAARLLGEERFADALAVVESLPATDDPRLDLLHGVLLLQTGRVQQARRTCRQSLARRGPGPDAQHLLGMCHEAAGEEAAAVAAYRTAGYLAPEFAMPRLRLGLLARRRGEVDTAAVELARAVELLPREHDQRILLFSGGFGRPALITLCRAELAARGVVR